MRAAAMAVSLAIGLFAWSAAQATSAEEAERQRTRLFHIEISTSENVVVFDALHGGEGFDRNRPIDVHWIMRAKEGQREELTWLERRMAYGIGIKRQSFPEIVFHLVSLPERPITATLGPSGPAASMEIGGRQATLQRVFVSVKEGLVPGVHYVEVRGVTDDGEEVRERITP